MQKNFKRKLTGGISITVTRNLVVINLMDDEIHYPSPLHLGENQRKETNSNPELSTFSVYPASFRMSRDTHTHRDAREVFRLLTLVYSWRIGFTVGLRVIPRAPQLSRNGVSNLREFSMRA